MMTAKGPAKKTSRACFFPNQHSSKFVIQAVFSDCELRRSCGILDLFRTSNVVLRGHTYMTSAVGEGEGDPQKSEVRGKGVKNPNFCGRHISNDPNIKLFKTLKRLEPPSLTRQSAAARTLARMTGWRLVRRRRRRGRAARPTTRESRRRTSSTARRPSA